MKLTIAPATITVTDRKNTSPSVGTFSANYTGGAPGTPSYSWAVSPVPGGGSGTWSLLNPTNASSQNGRCTSPSLGRNETDLQCTITEPTGQTDVAAGRAVYNYGDVFSIFTNSPTFTHGYYRGGSSTISPSESLSDPGKKVFSLYDASDGSFSTLQIDGFTSNPGTTWLDRVRVNGVTRSGSAANYSYAGGQATWEWPSQVFGMAEGVTYNDVVILKSEFYGMT